ncbi:MAG: hypothetical protein HUK07_04720, partial [Bacteroidaceae bacterium]|nr:hypothetical protein [Bacteroidaceae bacterium]
ENLKTNGYWLNIMGADYEYGIDALTNTKAAINALSPESVANFVKTVILPGNKVKIVMLPEE